MPLFYLRPIADDLEFKSPWCLGSMYPAGVSVMGSFLSRTFLHSSWTPCLSPACHDANDPPPGEMERATSSHLICGWPTTRLTKHTNLSQTQPTRTHPGPGPKMTTSARTTGKADIV